MHRPYKTQTHRHLFNVIIYVGVLFFKKKKVLVSCSGRTLDAPFIISVGATKVIVKSLVFLFGLMVNNEMIRRYFGLED